MYNVDAGVFFAQPIQKRARAHSLCVLRVHEYMCLHTLNVTQKTRICNTMQHVQALLKHERLLQIHRDPLVEVQSPPLAPARPFPALRTFCINGVYLPQHLPGLP